MRTAAYVGARVPRASAFVACLQGDGPQFIDKTPRFIPESDRPQFVVICVLLQVTVTVTPEHAGRGSLCA